MIYSILKARQKSQATPEPSSGSHEYESKISWKLIVTWLLSFSGGLIIGLLPVWNFALENGLHRLILELKGDAIRGIEGLPWLLQSLQHLINLVIFGSTVVFGLRPPWDITWLGLPLLPFILIFWLFVIGYILRYLVTGNEKRKKVGLLLGVIFTLVVRVYFHAFRSGPFGTLFPASHSSIIPVCCRFHR